jgi:hypothetical protein
VQSRCTRLSRIGSSNGLLRWLALLTLKKPELTIAEVQLAAAALAAMPLREETALVDLSR